MIYLADRFKPASATERCRVEDFVGDLWPVFHLATGLPFGPIHEFLQSACEDIGHRLKLIGLELYH